MSAYPFEIEFFPLAPLFSRNFRGPRTSNEIPEKTGVLDSRSERKRGTPTGGSKLVCSLEVLRQVGHLFILEAIIFLAFATIVAYLPSFI